MTKLAVLVADLQSSTKICAELPPDEYFELINQMWNAMGKHLRRFQGTHGKHVGDGLVYYFLPRPDGDYLHNAIESAIQMRASMAEISEIWARRKGWLKT